MPFPERWPAVYGVGSLMCAVYVRAVPLSNTFALNQIFCQKEEAPFTRQGALYQNDAKKQISTQGRLVLALPSHSCVSQSLEIRCHCESLQAFGHIIW